MKIGIYAYRKRSSNKIVYVGQSVNIEQRHKDHLYVATNKNCKDYNYPLSRGIRKYGEQEYELIILEENLPKEKLNEREKYWIKYYNTYWNGYNQSIGGTYPTKPIIEDDIIYKVIEMLKDYSYSLSDISRKTGISLTHIYNINIGARRKQDDIQYPIRENNIKGTKGQKFSLEEVLEIHSILKNTNKSINKIAQEFNCSPATISHINKGDTKTYHLDNWDYPIRDNSNMARY